MSDEITKLQTPKTDEYLGGGCPICGISDGYLRLGSTYYSTCREHKASWEVGENLFYSPDPQRYVDWLGNYEYLQTLVEVAPVRDLEPEVSVSDLAPITALENWCASFIAQTDIARKNGMADAEFQMSSAQILRLVDDMRGAIGKINGLSIALGRVEKSKRDTGGGSCSSISDDDLPF